MRMNEIDFEGMPPVDGYGPGFFRVAGEVMEGHVLILPSGPQSWAGLEDLSALEAELAQIDVVFFGMGAEIAHLPAAVRSALSGTGTAFEAMATPAAARTYNVLLSEGRRVAAALLTV